MQPGLEVCTALTHGMDAARGFGVNQTRRRGIALEHAHFFRKC